MVDSILLAAAGSQQPSHFLHHARETSPLKTRVWGFRQPPSGRFSSRRRRTREIATGSTRCNYETASGRRQWINRDPIEELGGVNLYALVGNNPAGRVDIFGLAPGDKYPNADMAACHALTEVNPKSVNEGREYAGQIYKNKDGSFSYTKPRPGTKDSSSPGGFPKGTKSAGTYHTHGKDDPGYDNNNFSINDKVSDAYIYGSPGYVATPDGSIKKNTPDKESKEGGVVKTLLPPGFCGQRKKGF